MELLPRSSWERYRVAGSIDEGKAVLLESIVIQPSREVVGRQGQADNHASAILLVGTRSTLLAVPAATLNGLLLKPTTSRRYRGIRGQVWLWRGRGRK
jgi:hypothetical protein